MATMNSCTVILFSALGRLVMMTKQTKGIFNFRGRPLLNTNKFSTQQFPFLNNTCVIDFNAIIMIKHWRKLVEDKSYRYLKGMTLISNKNIIHDLRPQQIIAKYDLPVEMINRIIKSKSNDGFLAEIALPDYEDRREDVSARSILIPKLSDPNNLGSIIRSAAILGASQVVLSPQCTDPFSFKTVAVSRGTSLSGSLRITSTNLFALKKSPVLLCELRSKIPIARGYAQVLQNGLVKVFSKSNVDIRDASIMVGCESNGFEGMGSGDLPDNYHYVTIDAHSPQSLNVSTALAIVIATLWWQPH